MEVNGDAIYGTQAGPFTRLPWGKATAKVVGDGHRLYLHVFQWPESGELFVPGLQTMPAKGHVLGGAEVAVSQLSQTRGGVQIVGLATQPVNSAATVIALDFDEAPMVAPFRVYAATDGSFALEPTDAVLKNVKFHDNEMFSRSNIDSWKENSHAKFPLQVETAGKYEVLIEYGGAKLKPDAEFVLSAGGAELDFKVGPTGGPKRWKEVSAGELELPAGKTELQLTCKSIVKSGVVKVAKIRLKPAG